MISNCYLSYMSVYSLSFHIKNCNKRNISEIKSSLHCLKILVLKSDTLTRNNLKTVIIYVDKTFVNKLLV